MCTGFLGRGRRGGEKEEEMEVEGGYGGKKENEDVVRGEC